MILLNQEFLPMAVVAKQSLCLCLNPQPFHHIFSSIPLKKESERMAWLTSGSQPRSCHPTSLQPSLEHLENIIMSFVEHMYNAILFNLK